MLQVRADRHTFRPYGLYGGSPGKVVAQPPHLRWPRAGADGQGHDDADAAGRRLHPRPAGAGGWGDPLERDPARVLRDVVNELVGLESARDDYGVIIDATTLAVDEAATARGGGASCGQRAAGRLIPDGQSVSRDRRVGLGGPHPSSAQRGSDFGSAISRRVQCVPSPKRGLPRRVLCPRRPPRSR